MHGNSRGWSPNRATWLAPGQIDPVGRTDAIIPGGTVRGGVHSEPACRSRSGFRNGGNNGTGNLQPGYATSVSSRLCLKAAMARISRREISMPCGNSTAATRLAGFSVPARYDAGRPLRERGIKWPVPHSRRVRYGAGMVRHPGTGATAVRICAFHDCTDRS